MRPQALLFCLLFLLLSIPAAGPAAAASPEKAPPESVRAEDPDLQWFRDQLHIAPKYQEHQEGVFGLSWLHFLTMVFLVIFFLAAIVVHVMQIRRKQEIIDTLLREEEEGNTGS